jgi:L,D-transpeptidase ErfK/SrfK
MTFSCNRRSVSALVLASTLVAAADAAAQAAHIVTPDAPDLIGALSLTTTVYADTLSDLARAYSQGYNEMRLANPEVDPWIPGEGTEVVVPSQYVIPQAPRDGIVINVPEMRLYFFSKPGRDRNQRVMTFPISIGRQEWVTPKGRTTVVGKVKNPSWYPPASIRKEHAELGDPLPMVVPPGPDNPLGSRALRLGLTGYLIHGTDKPYGIGMRVTHGCIRMYPQDAETIYDLTAVGTPVHIINQPYKVGMAHGRIYLEVHPHLDEDQAVFSDQYSHVVKLILARVGGRQAQLVWADIRAAIEAKTGIPRVIGGYALDAPTAVRAEQTGDGAG